MISSTSAKCSSFSRHRPYAASTSSSVNGRISVRTWEPFGTLTTGHRIGGDQLLPDTPAALRLAHPGWLALAAVANLASQVTRAVGWNALLPLAVPFRRLVRFEFAVQATSAVPGWASGVLTSYAVAMTVLLVLLRVAPAAEPGTHPAPGEGWKARLRLGAAAVLAGLAVMPATSAPQTDTPT